MAGVLMATGLRAATVGEEVMRYYYHQHMLDISEGRGRLDSGTTVLKGDSPLTPPSASSAGSPDSALGCGAVRQPIPTTVSSVYCIQCCER